MNLDPTFGLPCPDGTDAAAVALYLQRLAEAVEAKLLDQRTRIRAAARTPVAVWRSYNTVGPISNSGFANFSIDTPGLAFANYGVQFVPGGPLFPPAIGQGNRTFSEPGTWQVGIAVKTSETGAVNAATGRKIQMVLYQQTPAAGNVIRARMDREMVTSANANEWATWTGTFTVGDDVANWYMAMLFTHTNAGSTVQITAGDLIMWAVKLSSADQIEVI